MKEGIQSDNNQEQKMLWLLMDETNVGMAWYVVRASQNKNRIVHNGLAMGSKGTL